MGNWVRSLWCSYQGPYCREFDSFEELDLHEKLYHSRYLSKECPKCMMRFLEDKQLKHHLHTPVLDFVQRLNQVQQAGRVHYQGRLDAHYPNIKTKIRDFIFICIIEINQ